MKHILIIDDEELVREGIREFLEGEGYIVETAINGQDALHKLLEFNPDVIVTDIIMPESDGIEVIMHVRNRRPRPKIIAISGGGRISASNHLNTARKLGADEILVKPFSIEELIFCIERT